jgi:hypothetical protein
MNMVIHTGPLIDIFPYSCGVFIYLLRLYKRRKASNFHTYRLHISMLNVHMVEFHEENYLQVGSLKSGIPWG